MVRVQDGTQARYLRELADAVRELDMVFAVSSHRAEHWWYFDGGRAFPSDVQDPANDGLYGPAVEASKDKFNREEWKKKDWTPRPDAKFLEDWLARCCELVDKYQPQVVWFDWWIEQVVLSLTCSASPPIITTEARSGAKRRHQTTNTTLIPKASPYLISSAAS